MLIVTKVLKSNEAHIYPNKFHKVLHKYEVIIASIVSVLFEVSIIQIKIYIINSYKEYVN